MKAVAEHALTRTLTPYVGQTAILAIVTVMGIVVGVWRGVWQLGVAPLICWLFYAVLVFIGVQYRIFWTSDYVRRKASGGPDLVINIDDIAEVTKEMASADQMIAASAPFRRITIRSRSGEHIYVSLRHFRLDDIRSLMHFIHDRRPDLAMPKGFV